MVKTNIVHIFQFIPGIQGVHSSTGKPVGFCPSGFTKKGMCISNLPKKLFGVALDPADDPWSLQLKQAWMAADTGGLDWLSACRDPYDAVIGSLADMLREHRIEPAGKVSIPTWLSPKPEPADLPYVTAESMAAFFDSGDLLEITRRIQSFVREKILPDIPIMLGVDHSATAGVVAALSERYGAEELGVLVLDQHFDALPLSVRLAGIDTTAAPVGFSDSFCCGNFWAWLIDSGAIRPQNLAFIGVADYPAATANPRREPFRRAYLDFEERGCRFFPLDRFQADYGQGLDRFIGRTAAPNVYVSLDLDVASYAGTRAARYMDRPGLGRETVMEIARAIAAKCRQGSFRIGGLDIMEFNMHFLGIQTPDGARDTTLDLAGEFIAALT
jgi:arginase family enzyme